MVPGWRHAITYTNTDEGTQKQHGIETEANGLGADGVAHGRTGGLKQREARTKARHVATLRVRDDIGNDGTFRSMTERGMLWQGITPTARQGRQVGTSTRPPIAPP